MSYEAIVCRLVNVRSHPGADRLRLATAAGNQVVVGLDSRDGDLGVMFVTDGQLSEEYCTANDLIARKDSVTGERTGGYFSSNRRVRAQKFRGEKSDGYFAPIDSLAYTYTNFAPWDDGHLKEGDTFSELNGHPICNKYYTPATLRAMKSGKGGGKEKREATKYFPKQPDVPQFRHVINTVPYPAVVYLSEKCHGTSARYGHVLDEVYLPWWKRAINRLYPIFSKQEYTLLNGSRNVILKRSIGEGYYGSNAFRYDAVKDWTLHKSETLYFEICGFVSGETKIMPDHPISDKELKKRYGDRMAYRYGCTPGQQKIFVYRITRVNEDGIITELSWMQMVMRCHELELQPVPLLEGPIVYAGNPEMLREIVEKYTEGPSTVDQSHIREGVVARIETAEGFLWMKNKSHTFGVLEGYLKEDDTYVDVEETA